MKSGRDDEVGVVATHFLYFPRLEDAGSLGLCQICVGNGKTRPRSRMRTVFDALRFGQNLVITLVYLSCVVCAITNAPRSKNVDFLRLEFANIYTTSSSQRTFRARGGARFGDA